MARGAAVLGALVVGCALGEVGAYGGMFSLKRYCQADQPIAHAAPEGYKIIQAQVMNRHGDRAPGELWTWPKKYPPPTFDCTTPVYAGIEPGQKGSPPQPERLYRVRNIPGAVAYPGTCKMGQLTPKGASQLETLGKALRSVYIDTYNLLPSNARTMVNDKDTTWFACECTANRCLQSLESLLDGLYPPDGTNMSIPIDTDSTDGGDPLNSPFYCSNFAEYLANNTASPEWAKFNKSIVAPLAIKWAKELDISVDVVATQVIPHMLDWFGASYCHNHPLPLGMTEEEGSVAANIRATWWWLLYDRPQSGYTIAGNFFQKVIAEQRARITGGPGSKRYIQWSGHDISLMTALGALGLRDQSEWPPYGSSMAFEMWEDKLGNHHIRMLFQDRLIKLPCGTAPYYFCSFNQFESFVSEHVNIYDWQKKCPSIPAQTFG